MLTFSLMRRRLWSARPRRRAPSSSTAGSHPSRCAPSRRPAGTSGMASGVETDEPIVDEDSRACRPRLHHQMPPGTGLLAGSRCRRRPQVDRRRGRRPPRGELKRPLFGRVTVARYTNRIRSERQIANGERGFAARSSVHHDIGVRWRRSNQQVACLNAAYGARCGTRWYRRRWRRRRSRRGSTFSLLRSGRWSGLGRRVPPQLDGCLVHSLFGCISPLTGRGTAERIPPTKRQERRRPETRRRSAIGGPLAPRDRRPAARRAAAAPTN